MAFPKCYYASVEDSILVLENLKIRNFEVIEKRPDGKVRLAKYRDLIRSLFTVFRIR